MSIYKIVKSRLLGNRPFILSHLITNRCNLNCLTCLWKEETRARTRELSTNEVIGLYQEAQACGFLWVVIWGGEPLLRDDLGKILREAKKTGLKTSLITSGYALPHAYDEICPNLDILLVSIDAPDENNDRIRGGRGAFQRAIKGIELVRSAFPKVRISIISVISRLNLHQIEGLIKFAAELGLPITFQSMNTQDYGFVNRRVDPERLILNHQEEREIFSIIREYKSRGYRITNSPHYIDAFRRGKLSYRCHYKKVVFRVEADGKVLDCTARRGILGDVLEKPLREILTSRNYREFLRRAEGCSRCRDSATMECSYLWELKPKALWNAVRMSPLFPQRQDFS